MSDKEEGKDMISGTQEKQIETFSKKMELAAKQIRDIRNGKIPSYNLQEQLDKIDAEVKKGETES